MSEQANLMSKPRFSLGSNIARKLTSLSLLEFSSGLPLALISTTLQAWYASEGIPLKQIAALSLVGFPYALKFLWAPLLDKYSLPLLERRKGWILLTQFLLILSFMWMALLTPTREPMLLALVALIAALFSATQDIGVDAWRTEMLDPPERGIGAAFANAGYRGGMLVAGGLALILADQMGWMVTYFIMACLMLTNFILTLFIPPSRVINDSAITLKEAILNPFKEFFAREQAFAWLFFIILYKMCDAFATTLTPTFLIREMGFSLSDVGVATKIVGITAIIMGVFTGGILLIRLRLFTALLIFGLLQALSNLLFVWLIVVGKNYVWMYASIFAENFCTGMLNAAFLSLLMALCDLRYTATQFALFSALAMLARSLAGPVAGIVVEMMGWMNFYIWTCVSAFPGLLLLYYLREQVECIHGYKQKEKKLACAS